MQKSRLIKNIFLLLSFYLNISVFQNCDWTIPANLLGGGFHTSTQDLSGGSNGGSYDGMSNHYQRLVPGYSCAAQTAAFASLDLNGSVATIFSSDGKNCLAPHEVPAADLMFSKYSSKYIGYQNGLFTHLDNAQLAIQNNNFTEAWCQADETKMPDGSTLPGFEIAIEWQQAGNVAISSFYVDKKLPPQTATVQRALDIDHVSYSGNGGNLQIQTYIPAAIANAPLSSYFSIGNYQGLISGHLVSTRMNCLLGGQFDPVAPKFDYPMNFQTLELGSQIASLTPSLSQPAVEFGLDKQLPKGLTFDSTTGIIAGTALSSAARQVFTVTAIFNFGEVSRALSIGVGQAAKVGPQTTLQEAINLGNSSAPLPLIIKLPDGTTSLGGSAFLITGDIQIQGVGPSSILDARRLSQHFLVQNGSSLSIENLTLTNGAGVLGGSINVSKGRLNISQVKFTNNVASTNQSGQGGAIYADQSDLGIYDSSFINNSTPTGGQDLRGGAIYAQYSNSLIIRRSQFTGNSSAEGGALYLNFTSQCVLELTDLKLTGNTAMVGGAVSVYADQASFTNVDFENNSALFWGGGMYAQWNQKIWIEASQFSGNQAQQGSAIYFLPMNATSGFYILDSRITGNLLDSYSQTYLPNYSGTALFVNNVVNELITMRGSVFQKNERLHNCQVAFANSTNWLFSMGSNISDDKSCPLNDSTDQVPK